MYLSRGKFNKKKRGEYIALYWSTVVQLYQGKNNEPKGKGKEDEEENYETRRNYSSIQRSWWNSNF